MSTALVRHEAAHAAAAVCLGYQPTSVEIRSDGGVVRVPLTVTRENARDVLLIALAGRIGDETPNWPTEYPPRRDKSDDERQAAILADYLGLDEKGWNQAVGDAWRLAGTRRFALLEHAFKTALQATDHLDREYITAVIGATMQHKTLSATTTVVDQDLGEFEAIVSAWHEDREKDVILPTAFDKTIKAWQDSGKMIPLLFAHSTESVGIVDPFTLRPTEAGLVAAGQVDRTTEKGQQTWRQIKNRSAGFSIGFAAKSRLRDGGGKEIVEIDLLEISFTSTPMHPATSVLAWKSATDDRYPMLTPEQQADLAEMSESLRVALSTPIAKDGADKKAIDHRPVEIASFEC